MHTPPPLPRTHTEIGDQRIGQPLAATSHRSAAPVQILPYLTPLGAVPQGIWREGNVLVAANGTELPPFCVKCNAPSDPPHMRTKFWWHHPALWLLLLIPSLGLFVCLIVIRVVRKNGIVHYGLCATHRRERTVGGIAGAALALAGATGLIYAVMHNEPAGIVLGLVGFVAGLVVVVWSRSLRPKRIDHHYLWLKGAGPDYLDRFGSVAAQ